MLSLVQIVLALARSRSGSGDMDRMRVKCASSTKAALIISRFDSLKRFDTGKAILVFKAKLLQMSFQTCCRVDSSFRNLPGVCTNLERRAVRVPLKTAAQFRA